MTAYYTNEAAFELLTPPLADRTETSLELEAPSGGAVWLTIKRRPWPEGKSLRDVVKEHLSQMALMRTRPGVLFEREREVAGGPAVEIGSRARGDGGMVFTHECIVPAGATCLLISVSALFADQEAASAHLWHVLDTLRMRG